MAIENGSDFLLKIGDGEAPPAYRTVAGLRTSILEDTARCDGEWPFSGYAASGDRIRDALAPLFEADGIRLLSGPDGWRMAPATRR